MIFLPIISRCYLKVISLSYNFVFTLLRARWEAILFRNVTFMTHLDLPNNSHKRRALSGCSQWRYFFSKHSSAFKNWYIFHFWNQNFESYCNSITYFILDQPKGSISAKILYSVFLNQVVCGILNLVFLIIFRCSISCHNFQISTIITWFSNISLRVSW